jgi:predicted phosphodiesterase
LYFNPASAGRKRFANPRSVGMLELAGEEVTATFLSLE